MFSLDEEDDNDGTNSTPAKLEPILNASSAATTTTLENVIYRLALNEQPSIDSLLQLDWKTTTTTTETCNTRRRDHVLVPRVAKLVLLAKSATPAIPMGSSVTATDENGQPIKRKKVRELHDEIREKLVNKFMTTVIGTKNPDPTNRLWTALLSGSFELKQFVPHTASDDNNNQQYQYWSRRHEWCNEMLLPRIEAVERIRPSGEEENQRLIEITLYDVPMELATFILSTYVMSYAGTTDWLTRNNWRTHCPTLSAMSQSDKRTSFIKNALKGSDRVNLYLFSNTCWTLAYDIECDKQSLVPPAYLLYLVRSATALHFNELGALLWDDDDDHYQDSIKWATRMGYPSLPTACTEWRQWVRDDTVPVNERDGITRQVARRINLWALACELCRIYSIHSDAPIHYTRIDCENMSGIDSEPLPQLVAATADVAVVVVDERHGQRNTNKKTSSSPFEDVLAVGGASPEECAEWRSMALSIGYRLAIGPLTCTSWFEGFGQGPTKVFYKKQQAKQKDREKQAKNKIKRTNEQLIQMAEFGRQKRITAFATVTTTVNNKTETPLSSSSDSK